MCNVIRFHNTKAQRKFPIKRLDLIHIEYTFRNRIPHVHRKAPRLTSLRNI